MVYKKNNKFEVNLSWEDIKLLRGVAQDYATPSRFAKQVKIDLETGSFDETKKRINKLEVLVKLIKQLEITP